MTMTLAGVGAVVGAAVAVLVHFLSWQVVRGEHGVQGYASLNQLSGVLRPTHPGWSTMLALYIGIGVVVGALAGWTIWSLGREVKLVRRDPPPA
jgi:ribose/xylose/arabinose/galactoside ABC-type transport system permease subunit